MIDQLDVASNGVISGTPTEAGTWRFCIHITDGVDVSDPPPLLPQPPEKSAG